ncbi:MAG: transposase [Fibrella sp.]|nr:transposase [Armatimonadota bacterium]
MITHKWVPGARHREKTDSRTGERNGSYQRSLIMPVGKIEQLRVPPNRDGTFTPEVFEEIPIKYVIMWVGTTFPLKYPANPHNYILDRNRTHPVLKCR